MVEILRDRMNQLRDYHNHKESMAYLGFAVLLGLMAWIVSTDSWPPTWIPRIGSSLKLFGILSISVLWLILHIFIRWQLRWRRIASIYCKSIFVYLITHQNVTNAKLYKKKNNKKSKWRFIDYFIPLRKFTISMEEEIGFPKAIVKDTKAVMTGALWGEWLVVIGSYLIYAVILIRICS